MSHAAATSNALSAHLAAPGGRGARFLPTAAQVRRRYSQRKSAWLTQLLLRVFTCFVVCFAVPGCATLAQDVVTWVNGGECCDGNCDDSSTDCCPKTCAHCAHANAVTTASESLVQTPAADVIPFFWWTEDASASGYRAPPFRPPST